MINIIKNIFDITPDKSMELFFIGLFALFVLASFSAQFKLRDKTWALILLVISVIYSFAVLFLARKFSLRLRIVSLVICYIGLIISFASIHFIIFLRNPKAYVFAESVSARQQESTFTSLGIQLVDVRQAIAALKVLLNQPDTVLDILKAEDLVHLGDISIELYRKTYATPPAGVYTTYSLKFYFHSPETSYSISGDFINDPKASAIRGLFAAKTTARLRANIDGLMTILVDEEINLTKLQKANLPIWDYVHFLYFSAIVMTTVGLGDILTTSNLSRIIVAIQAFSGVLLTAFAFTFLWPQT